MNRQDYKCLLEEIRNELNEPNGTFESMFGKKNEKEQKEMEYIAAIALVAADRYYSRQSKMQFELREKDENKY